MDKASEYKTRAAECRALAARMTRPDQREQMLEMAKAWDVLAEERARIVQRSQDLDGPGRGPAGPRPTER